MKQYCRYCALANQVDDDLVYCQPKNKVRQRKECVRLNKCKLFELNEIDVFDGDRKYKPMKPKTVDGEQIRL